MYKYFYFTLLAIASLLTTAVQTFAQETQIEVSGTVTDKKSGASLNFASVALLHASDSSIIAGGNTNEKGAFTLKTSYTKDLLLKISYLGYQSRMLSLHLKKGTKKLTLGKVTLAPFSSKLNMVTVTAEKKKMYEFKKDSIVFNVPEDFETGGTAQDVLEYTPSLTMDADNNIMVKGKGNVGVYIDNKPIRDLGFSVQEYLENTPAFMIEKIEILKTPPDPEDAAKALAAGVTDRYYLNILTRKIRFRGYSAALTGGLNTHDEQTGRIRFNMNMKPFQLNYNNNLRGRTDSNYLHRTSFIGDEDSSVLDQKSYSKSLRFNQNLNARYTFQFAQKEELRLRARLDWNKRKDQRSSLSKITNPKDVPDQDRIQTNESHSNGYGFSGSADYKKEYEKKGKELRASVNIRQRNNTNDRHSLDNYRIKSDSLFQKNGGNSTSRGLRSNLQYKNSFGSENKHFYVLNGSFSWNDRHNLNDVSRSDTTASSHQLYMNKRLSTNYFNNNESYGALALIGKRDKKLGWVAAASLSYNLTHSHDTYRGSRVNNDVLSSRNALGMNFSPGEEQMISLHFNPGFQSYEQKTIANDSAGLNTYKYTNFIPGASAKYELGDHEISFHYDRKTRQPSWDQLNPYVDNNDPLNIRTGNPDLRPQFTNEYKLRYEYNHNSFYASFNLEDDLSKDVISGYTTVDSSGVSTRTYVNLKERKKKSADLNAGIHYFKDLPDWDASINVNAGGGLSAYQMRSDDEHVSEDFRNVSGLSSNLKIWTALKVKFLSLILKGRYYGPRYFSQGKRPARFRSGLRTRASFFQHDLNISLGIENLFGASVEDNFYKTDRYIQYSNNRQDVRYFSLYVTYRFKSYKKLGQEGDDG